MTAGVTFTVRIPGTTAYREGIPDLTSAEVEQQVANRVRCPGHQLYAVHPDGSVVELPEDYYDE